MNENNRTPARTLGFRSAMPRRLPLTFPKTRRLERRSGAGRTLTMLAIGAALAGCSGPDRGGPAEVVLHAADWAGSSADPRMNRIQAEITVEWSRLHPGVRVELEHIPGSGEYVSKLLTAFVAGTEPDVVALDDASAAAFINNASLRDLMPLVRRDRLDLSVYYPNVLDLARRGDHLYAIPADFTPLVLYYNRRHFREAGVPLPRDGWIWDEFRDAAKRLTMWPSGVPHPTRYGYLAENWMPGWIAWIWSNGGDVLSPDGTRAAGYLDGPASAEAVGFFAGLVRERVAPSLSQAQTQGADPFEAGQVSMTVTGHWKLVSLLASERIRMEDVGVVGLPQHKRRVTSLYESGYAVTARCRHPEAAWEYVKFMSGPFVQRKKAELGIGISANRVVAETRRSASPLEPVFLANVRYGIAPWGARVENYSAVEDIGKEMMDEVLVGGVPVEQALAAAAKRADAALAGGG